MNVSQQQYQKPIISEALVLQEIREMKEIFLKVVKNNSSLNYNDVILQHLQNTVKKLNEKVNDLSESLLSISMDVAKLQSTNAKDNYLNNVDVNKSIDYLNKHIKDLTPKTENFEKHLRLILTILRGFVESNPSKSLRIGKIESHLKFIYSSMKRQGSKDKPIFSEIKEVLNLLKQSKEPMKQITNQNIIGDIVENEDSQIESPKLNKNQNNGSVQNPNEVQQAAEIENLNTQMAEEMEYLQPEGFQDCCSSDKITCLMQAIQDTFQTVYLTDKSSETLLELQRNINFEVCKHYSLQSETSVEIQDVNINQSSDVNSLNSTPELISIMNKIKSFLEQIQSEFKFDDTDMLTALYSTVKCIKEFVHANKGDLKTMRALLVLLKNVECELYKQEGSAELILREIICLRKHMEVVYNYPPPKTPQNRTWKLSANLSISERSRGIKETQILKCLIHHLRKFMSQYSDDIQFPQSNFFNHVKLVLDTMIAVTGSHTVDEGYKEQLPKIMRCLEFELDKQKDGRYLLKKVNQIRVNLGLKSTNIDPNKLLSCLVHYLRKLVKMTRPDIEIPEVDKETLLSFLLDPLKDATQSGEFNSETLRKLLKVMQCIICCLNADGQQTPALTAKIQDMLQLIANHENELTQQEQHMPTTSDIENIQE
ncbi:hypothetical protein ACTXT7_011179 [Hymenolepis weldensis]